MHRGSEEFEKMNFMFCGDANISRGLIMSVISLSRMVCEPIDVYILTAGAEVNGRVHEPIGEDTIRALESIIQSSGKGGAVSCFDLTKMLASEPPTANMSTRFTPMCMLRLYSDTITALPDRILYLDTDVICLGDPSPLYYADISDSDVAGVPDRYGKWLFDGGIFTRSYINSGVLLLNMKRIREGGVFRKARRMCAEKKMFMPDQSAINKLAKKRFVNRRFNEQSVERDDTVFRHFTTTLHLLPYPHSRTVKPWQRERMHELLKNYKYDSLIDECERITEEIKK